MSRIEQRQAVPVWEALVCECGKEMTYTGMAYPVNPMRYEHRCECGNTESPTAVYPRVAHKRGEPLTETGELPAELEIS